MLASGCSTVAAAAVQQQQQQQHRGASWAAHQPLRLPGRQQRGRHAASSGGAAALRRPRRGAAAGIAAVSSPERLTVTDRTPPPPPPQLDVKVVGIGSRGAAALSKLVAHGKVDAAELWYLDTDAAALEAAAAHTPNTLLLPKDGGGAGPGEGWLAPADLARLVGRAASDAGGRGNINAGTDGAVVFVLAPAAAAPGGAATVLQVVQALRAAGHFTVAAVTQPFAFEGPAKQEQASELVGALRGCAHMVAVMEQEVLMQAFGGAQMTVSEATDIADNALEHSVRAVLQAVQAQEVLKSSRGALMWHGANLRHFKRLLAPPLQELLTQPGSAVLGRGLASMPAEAAHQMGAVQALMHLASDAVRAAAESPFLEGALGSASGVLCCIRLPPVAQQFAGAAGGGAGVLQGLQTPDGERRAVHMAAQAAAGALGSLAGAGCQDYVLCADPRPPAEAQADGSLVQVEVTLLVLRPPEGGEGAAPRAAAAMQQPAFRVGPAVPAPPRPAPQQPQRLPSSTWQQLSAMAGGAAGKAAAAPAEAKGKQQAQQKPQQAQRILPNFFGGGGARQRQEPPPQTPAQKAAPPPAPQQQPAAAAQPAPAAAAAPPPPQVQPQAQVQPQPSASTPAAPAAAAAAGDQERRVTVGEYLADSLTAQSLDLPPAAAQWRQEHRSDAFLQRKLIVWEVDETEPWEEEEEPQGLAALLPMGRPKAKRVNLKSRMASILMQDREDAWELANTSDDPE